VAVLADDTWSAIKGREALKIVWKPGPHAADSSVGLEQEAHRLLARPIGAGRIVRSQGDTATVFHTAARTLTRLYSVPFVAHAPMEPQNAFVHIEGKRARVIAPTQSPGSAAAFLRGIDVPTQNLSMVFTRAGGGFGRRLTTDYINEAALISKKT